MQETPACLRIPGVLEIGTKIPGSSPSDRVPRGCEENQGPAIILFGKATSKPGGQTWTLQATGRHRLEGYGPDGPPAFVAGRGSQRAARSAVDPGVAQAGAPPLTELA